MSFYLNNLHFHYWNFSLTLPKCPRIICKSTSIFPTGSVIVLFLPLLCQSDLRNFYNLHLHLDFFEVIVSGIYFLLVLEFEM